MIGGNMGMKGKYNWKGNTDLVDESVRVSHTPNPFAGSAPTRGGFQQMVNLECKSCGDSRVVRTDDFRLNWLCDDCKSTPILLRVISKYARTTGIIQQPKKDAPTQGRRPRSPMA